MMNKWYCCVLAGTLGYGLVACSDDDNHFQSESASFGIVADNDEFSVSQLDTLLLSSNDKGKYTDYQWSVNGEEAGTEEVLKFTSCKTGSYSVKCTACDKDGKLLSAEQNIEVTGRFREGTFILNEGNMGNETGTLTFIGEDGVAIDSAYFKVNGTLLGNVTEDLFINEGKLYVISQNGANNGGEGLLTVADAASLEKVKVYNDQNLTSKLDWPTNLAVQGDDIYIRDNAGVYLFKQSTGELTFIENTNGIAKQRMAVVGGKVFALQGKDLIVFENGKLIATYQMPGSVSGIAPSYDGNLWVSCNIKPGKILKLNPLDGKIIEEQDIQDGGLSAGWGVAPAFSAVKDTLYFTNATTTLYRHIFKMKKTEKVGEFKDYLPDAGMYYNSLGVNPKTGIVCFATLKGYGMDYKVNDIGLFDFSKEHPMIADFKSMNSFPAGVYYTYNFQ